MSLTEYHATRKARLARLMTPPGGRDSSELEIVTDPAVLRQIRVEALERVRREHNSNLQATVNRRWAEALQRFIQEYPHNPQSGTDSETEPPICKKPPKIRHIAEAVSKFYGVTLIDIVSERRTANVMRPRQVLCYLARTMTTRSYVEIGKIMGDRDHTTIMHAYLKIEALIKTDADLAAQVETIRGMLE